MFVLCLVSCSKGKKESEIIDMYVNDIAGEYHLDCYSYSYLKVEDINYLWCCYDPYYVFIVTNEGEEFKFLCYRTRHDSYKWQDIETQKIN
jgi:hypothetical protein